jgi:hypothetical protein
MSLLNYLSLHSVSVSVTLFFFMDLEVDSSAALNPFVGLWPLIRFRNRFTQTVGLL